VAWYGWYGRFGFEVGHVVTAAVIVAIAALITALGGLASAFAVLVPQLRKLSAKTDEVHTLVNSNHESMLRREEVLIAALQQNGIKIPPNEAIAVKEIES
jgi:hypothetical protein